MTSKNSEPGLAGDDPIGNLVEHMQRCHGASGAIVAQSGSLDATVAELLAAGWTWSYGDAESSTEHVMGKRVRYLHRPAS